VLPLAALPEFPLFGFPSEIRSVRHALAMLGEREVRRWIRLATTLVASQSRSSDLVLSALCEPASAS
jgi:HD-like signal output (HDOD) protein